MILESRGLHPGAWVISQTPSNTSATAFWFTIESAAELLKPRPVPPRRQWTLETVIDMWAALFTGGIIRWNSELRAVEMIRPMGDRARVLREWDADRRD